MPKVVAIHHIDAEKAGVLEREIKTERDYAFEYWKAVDTDWDAVGDPAKPALVIVMGGPMSVYNADTTPWLNEEIGFIRRRLEARQPTLGICLGAQIMAKALGADVVPGDATEIGYEPTLKPMDAAYEPSSPIHGLEKIDWRVLHWHADIIMPGDWCGPHSDVTLHAQSTFAPIQAFSVGKYGLGLQFHLEVERTWLTDWMTNPDMADQLANDPVADFETLLAQDREHREAVTPAWRKVLTDWLDGVGVQRRP